MKYVYIAGPYSKGDTVSNCRTAMMVWRELFDAGFFPMCPHWSVSQEILTPLNYEDWLAFDFAWIRRCDAVLRLPGDSPGADREVTFAEGIGLPVFYSVAELKAAKAREAA